MKTQGLLHDGVDKYNINILQWQTLLFVLQTLKQNKKTLLPKFFGQYCYQVSSVHLCPAYFQASKYHTMMPKMIAHFRHSGGQPCTIQQKIRLWRDKRISLGIFSSFPRVFSNIVYVCSLLKPDYRK